MIVDIPSVLDRCFATGVIFPRANEHLPFVEVFFFFFFAPEI